MFKKLTLLNDSREFTTKLTLSSVNNKRLIQLEILYMYMKNMLF